MNDAIPAELNRLTERIIGCASEAHRQRGPGLLESTYEAALAVEFEPAGPRFNRQVVCPDRCKGRRIAEPRRDPEAEDAVVVELKSDGRHELLLQARPLTHLKISANGLACSSTSTPASSGRASADWCTESP